MNCESVALYELGFPLDVIGLIEDYVVDMVQIEYNKGLYRCVVEKLHDTECFRMWRDIETYGTDVSGTYEGVRWSMLRVRQYWRVEVFLGDIDPVDGVVDGDMFEDADEIREITFDSATYVGWDCGHYGDYPVDRRGVFKTFGYNMTVVERMINYVYEMYLLRMGDHMCVQLMI